MKRKLLVLALGLFAATAIAAPAFASSSPPTVTLDSTPAAVAINTKAYTAPETNVPNITLKVDAVNFMRDTARPAPTLMPSTISGPPGWSAGITKMWLQRGDETYVGVNTAAKNSAIVLSPRPGDSATKLISATSSNAAAMDQVLLATAPPANGFAREDLLASSVNSVMGIGAA